MDKECFGLERIKRRLIELLVVVRLKEMSAERGQEADELVLMKSELKVDDLALVKSTSSPSIAPAPIPPAKKKAIHVKGPILLSVGPLGTEKTSLSQSVTKALNRPFQQMLTYPQQDGRNADNLVH